MAANWKMFKTPAETRAFFQQFRAAVADVTDCDIVICPPFTDLAAAIEETAGSNIGIGGQNLPVAVTLQEGGTTKTPSPSYRDTLTVTVTPLAMPYGGGTANCPGL